MKYFSKNEDSQKGLVLKGKLQLAQIHRLIEPVPYILGELRDNTASVGTKKNYPGNLVHILYNFFRNNSDDIFSMGNELTFCEVSRNSKSSRC